MTPDAEFLRRYAELRLSRFAANVQPGQIVELRSRDRARAAHAGDRRAAATATAPASSTSPTTTRTSSGARVEHADRETLDFVAGLAPRAGARLRARALRPHRRRRPRPTRALLDGLPARPGARDRWPFIPEYHTLIDEQTTNWAGANCPTPDWAAAVFPDLEPEEALERLWEAVAHCCRLDEPRPRGGVARAARRA